MLAQPWLQRPSRPWASSRLPSRHEKHVAILRAKSGQTLGTRAECVIARPDPFPFGSAGYVALFEIEDQTTVTILAIRHQREEDYQ